MASKRATAQPRNGANLASQHATAQPRHRARENDRIALLSRYRATAQSRIKTQIPNTLQETCSLCENMRAFHTFPEPANRSESCRLVQKRLILIIDIHMPRTQMTLALIEKGLVLEG